MKIYFRILSYARPMLRFVPIYLLFTLMAIVFGTLNFALLIPLLEVLFNEVEPEKMQQYLAAPENFDPVDYFYHYFARIVTDPDHGKTGVLNYICGAVFVSVLLANVFRYLSVVLAERIRVEMLKGLRADLFGKLLQLDLSYIGGKRKGDIMSRLVNDNYEIEGSINSSLQGLVRDPVQILVYFATLLIISPRLTLVTLVVIPVAGLIISTIVKKLRSVAREIQRMGGVINSTFDETLDGFRIVKAFGAEKYLYDKFYRENSRYLKLMRRFLYRKQLASPFSETMGVGVLIGVLLYGGHLILSDDPSVNLEASAFIGFLAIYSQIISPAKGVSNAISTIQRSLSAGERIFELMDTVPAIQDAPDAVALERFRESIVFDKVSFAYGETEVLRDVNFEIKKGQTVALVGPSGGGKSTLADLIPRFYDVKGGSVRIDGQDIRRYTLASVREQMGIVTQESVLFNDTVFNNIAFGTPEADREAVVQAAKVANAHGFVSESAEGYEMRIGDRGANLSGGQRQRLNIARAVFKNPPILILDEATSALDTESEKLVQDALYKLMRNRTSLVIAHRLSTIRNADLILVVEGGRIVERGTHEELLARADGLYRKLHDMQAHAVAT